jgi:hypothetical protein
MTLVASKVGLSEEAAHEECALEEDILSSVTSLSLSASNHGEARRLLSCDSATMNDIVSHFRPKAVEPTDHGLKSLKL